MERRGEAFAGDGVDAEPGRCRDGLVALLREPGNELRADEPAAADDDDLHERTSLRGQGGPMPRSHAAFVLAPLMAGVMALPPLSSGLLAHGGNPRRWMLDSALPALFRQMTRIGGVA